MGMARNTVMKLAHCESPPEHAGRSGGSYKLKPFLDYLRSRWTEGEHNAVVLHGEILAQGFCGSVSLVQRLVEPWREKSRRRVVPKPTIFYLHAVLPGCCRVKASVSNPRRKRQLSWSA